MYGAIRTARGLSARRPPIADAEQARLRLEGELRRQNAYLNALHETSLALLNRRDLSDLLQQIVDRATALVGAETGLINVVDADTDTLVTVAEVGPYPERVGMHLQRGEGVAGRAWETAKTAVVCDYESAPERLKRNAEVLPVAVAAVPLQVSSRVTGVLVVARYKGGASFTDEEVGLLERFAQLAALSLDAARLLTEAKAELDQRERAEAQVRFQASLLERVRNAVIAVDTEGKVTYWNQFAENLLGWTAAETAGRSLDAFIVPDTEEESVLARLADVELTGSAEGSGLVRRRDGSSVPVLTALAPLYGRDRTFLGLVGVSAEISELERARADAITQARRQGLVARFGRQAQANDDPVALMRRVVDLVADELGVSHCSIFELHPGERKLYFVAGKGWDHIADGQSVPIEGGTLGARAMRSDQPASVDDASADEGDDTAGMRNTGLRAGLGVPLHGTHAPFGALCVYAREPRAFAQIEVDFLQSIGNVLATAIERRRAEEALRGSERRFRALIERSTDVVLLFDHQGLVTYVSPSVTRVLGYTPEELIGRAGFDLIPPEETAHKRSELARILQEPGASVENSFRYRHKDGSWRQMEGVLTNLLHEPAVAALVINFRDVSDRLRIEQALRASEERFRSLVQNAADIIAIIDGDLRFRYVSPAVERVLGYSSESLLDRRGLELVHPEDAESVHRALFYDDGARREQSVVEFRARHSDGSWRIVQMTVTSSGSASEGGFVINARDVTESRQFEAQLQQRAFSDELTGLPNRALLMDRLEHGLARSGRSGPPLGLLFLDLDRFKLVNDSLGHSHGDELLKAAAQRLLGCVRPGDTVARFGGDEFVILLEDGDLPASAAAVAERVIQKFRVPFTLAGHDLYISASVGVVVTSAETYVAADVLRDADVALYRAKQSGRNRWVLFEPAMNARAMERLDLETDLRRALERREFELEFQPLVDLHGGGLTGAEALLRWHHPVLGLISPADFIPLAEETGLILPIGSWVLDESCRLAAAWPTGAGGRLTVSVNLSARQFQQDDLVGQVQRALEESGLAPGRLQLEITESVMMQSVEEALTALQSLKALGVQLAIDDFGTGYSSLSYLRRFPVDILKVDRSFVLELHHSHEAAAIVQSVVALAHALGLKVTAEGIETERHLARARTLGCDYGQGYYFARPLPLAELEALIRSGSMQPPEAAA